VIGVLVDSVLGKKEKIIWRGCMIQCIGLPAKLVIRHFPQMILGDCINVGCMILHASSALVERHLYFMAIITNM
jgi:hypothetical protein